MRVKDLIERLQTLDQNREVFYCYYKTNEYLPVSWAANGVNELDGMVVLDCSDEECED